MKPIKTSSPLRILLVEDDEHDSLAFRLVFFKDLKSRYVITNNRSLEVFGLSKEKVIGKNDYEIMPNKEEAKKNIEDD